MNIEQVFKNPQLQSVWSFTFFHPCLLLYFLCDLDLFYVLIAWLLFMFQSFWWQFCRSFVDRYYVYCGLWNKWLSWTSERNGKWIRKRKRGFQLPRSPTLHFPLPTSHFRISFSATRVLAYFQNIEPNLRHNFKVKTVMGDRSHDL